MHGLTALAAMWTLMMAAMMLPSAVPMIRLCGGAALQRAPRVAAPAWIAAFVLGYLAVWSAYGVGAALLHWQLQAADLLTENRISGPAAGAILILAGLYQWSALKDYCLQRCRSPLSFILLYWRDSVAGALGMGVRHGGYCVGCCWALMVLLFVGGVMNLLWIAALVALVIAERTLRAGPALARWVGLGLIAAGVYALLAA